MCIAQEVDETTLQSGAYQLRRENLFGNTDAQFNSAVQNLPAVKAARERAMLPGLAMIGDWIGTS